MQFQELRILSRSIIQELKQSNLPVNPSRENHLESPAKYATMVVQSCDHGGATVPDGDKFFSLYFSTILPDRF